MIGEIDCAAVASMLLSPVSDSISSSDISCSCDAGLLKLSANIINVAAYKALTEISFLLKLRRSTCLQFQTCRSS